jgi:hypothetical protein
MTLRAEALTNHCALLCGVVVVSFSALGTRINIGLWYLMLIDMSCHGFVLFACLCSTVRFTPFHPRTHSHLATKPLLCVLQ